MSKADYNSRISLDDFRILKSTLYGDQSRTHLTVVQFLTLSLLIHHFSSRFNSKEAQSQGYNYIENILSLKFRDIRLIMTFRSIFKVIIDKDTDLILGVTLMAKNQKKLL